MYELIIVDLEGISYTKIVKDCKHVDHVSGFVTFISNDGSCNYAVNQNKLISYEKID